MVVAVYGFSQGAGESLEEFAEKYIFLDPAPRGYGISASYYEALDALAGFPWICKAVYGLLSDTVPIRGFHKTGYLIISGTVGVVSFGALAGFPLVDQTLAFGWAGTWGWRSSRCSAASHRPPL